MVEHGTKILLLITDLNGQQRMVEAQVGSELQLQAGEQVRLVDNKQAVMLTDIGAQRVRLELNTDSDQDFSLVDSDIPLPADESSDTGFSFINNNKLPTMPVKDEPSINLNQVAELEQQQMQQEIVEQLEDKTDSTEHDKEGLNAWLINQEIAIAADYAFLDIEPRTNVANTTTEQSRIETITTINTSDEPNQSPTAVDLDFALNEDAIFNVGEVAGLLSEAYDPDGDPLTAQLVSGPANGSLAVNPDGSFVYTPNANYYGMDSFTFEIDDNAGNTSDIRTVTLTVSSVNDSPTLDNGGNTQLTGIYRNVIDSKNTGNTVANIIASGGGDQIIDSDGLAEGIAIYNLYGSGTWQYNLGDGWQDVGMVSSSSALLLRSTDLVRYVPEGLYAEATSLEYRAWDQTSGLAGEKADVSVNGGATAFSSHIESASLEVLDYIISGGSANNFQQGVTKIDVSSDELRFIGGNTNPETTQFSARHNEVCYYDDGTDTYIQIDDNADGNTDREIQLLGVTGVALAASDFIGLKAIATNGENIYDGGTGFYIEGGAAADHLGISLSSLGDVNGDGFDDFIIGADEFSKSPAGSGKAYVIFGSKDKLASIDFIDSTFDGSNGFVVQGIDNYDLAGRSVSGAGDVNGDGYADILVGASDADPNGITSAGEAYLIYGRSDFTSDNGVVYASALNGTDGTTFYGDIIFNRSGRATSNLGDINGDGIDDFAIAAPYANAVANSEGKIYVLYGTDSGYGAEFSLSDLETATVATQGFVVLGATVNDFLGGNRGTGMSAIGDINGDGVDDFLVGAYNGDGYDAQGSNYGEGYVIFGGQAFSPTLNVTDLDGSNGFRIIGPTHTPYAYAFYSVGGVGDINGDGYDDIVTGTARTSPNGVTQAGNGYIIFGTDNWDLNPNKDFFISTTLQNNIVQFNGEGILDLLGWAAQMIGDFNGDGLDDALYTAPLASNDVSYSGSSFILFGREDWLTYDADREINISDLGGEELLRIDGYQDFAFLGFSASAAGDINGDGYDDIILASEHSDINGNNSGESVVIYGYDTTNKASQIGTSEDDIIISSTDDAIIQSAQGNDLISIQGDVSGNVIYAGSGNDTIEIDDIDTLLNAQRIDGQLGKDTISIKDSNITFDLEALNSSTYADKINSIEVIDLNDGTNTLNLTLDDLFDITDIFEHEGIQLNNTLIVEGGASDTVQSNQSWAHQGQDAGGYTIYTQGNATLLIDSAITTDFA